MSNKWHWYVYILECMDGRYYTGRTWNLDIRYAQHLSGSGGKFTTEHKVKRLAYYEEFDNFEQASNREKQIQGWTREKKEMLINGQWKQEWDKKKKSLIRKKN